MSQCTNEIYALIESAGGVNPGDHAVIGADGMLPSGIVPSSGGGLDPGVFNLIKNAGVRDRQDSSAVGYPFYGATGVELPEEWDDEGTATFASVGEQHFMQMVMADSGPDFTAGAIYVDNAESTRKWLALITKVSGDGQTAPGFLQISGTLSESASGQINLVTGTGDANVTITAGMDSLSTVADVIDYSTSGQLVFSYTGGADDGWSQTFTFWKEPSLYIGQAVSAEVKVWTFGANTLTLGLYDQDDNLLSGASDTTSAASSAWVTLSVPNITIPSGDTGLKWKLTQATAALFAFKEPILNVGATALADFRPRAIVQRSSAQWAIALNSSAQSSQDNTSFDMTPYVSPNCVRAEILFTFNDTGGEGACYIADGWDTITSSAVNSVAAIQTNAQVLYESTTVSLTDAKVFKYALTGSAGNLSIAGRITGEWVYEGSR